MTKSLQHVGVLGMHWGQRRGRKGTFGHKPRPAKVAEVAGEKTKQFLQSRAAKSVSEAVKGTAKNAIVAATAFTVTYAALNAAEFTARVVVPNIAWATGKVISNSPLP